MEIKLIELIPENFKGLERFVFTPNGQNATIRGANATFKTTLGDSFRWLLFGKDMADNTDFAIKTISSDGQVRSNIEHSVSGSMMLDAQHFDLKKVYKEKWTKKRGEAHRQLTGHTTDHVINGVPVPQKEWDARLNGMIDEETFKLLTLPGYFNSLHWEKRRTIVILVAGDVSDADVINSDPKLVSLPEILGNRSIEDHRATVKAEQKAINGRLKEIPARIDELSRTLPTENLSRKGIEAFIKHLDHKIDSAKDDRELAGHRKELANAEAKLIEAQTAERKKGQAEEEEADKKTRTLKKQIREIGTKIDLAKISMSSAHKQIQANDQRMADLRQEYTFVASQKAEYDEICPVCHQSLPEDQIAKAQAAYANQMAEKLKGINGEGKGLKAENANLEDETQRSWSTAEGLKDDLKGAEAHLLLAETKPLNLPSSAIVDLALKTDKIKAIMAVRPKTDTTELELERRQEMAKLAGLDAAERTKNRIARLEKEEKALAGQFEELESQIFLMEKFTVAKVGLLEDKINSKFEIARFKMFETQINEGIKECCETVVGGVPYGRGLNKGMEMNADLDIIRTLSKRYDTTAPVWIDNAEAVTAPLEIPSQTIKLIVDPKFKEMEVSQE